MHIQTLSTLSLNKLFDRLIFYVASLQTGMNPPTTEDLHYMAISVLHRSVFEGLSPRLFSPLF